MSFFLVGQERSLKDNRFYLFCGGDDTIVGERTVDVHIRKLRERFGDKMIHTVKGVGYSIT